MEQLKITPEMANQRLDVVVANQLHISRNQVQKLFKQGNVLLDGAPVRASQAGATGSVVQIDRTPNVQGNRPGAPDLHIVYEDDDVMVVDKPAGLVVHAVNEHDTQASVVDFALEHGVVDDDQVRPGIVHRLDKDTSGLLIIAKNPAAKAYMQQQFRDRQVHKTYLALVRGHMDKSEATINLPVARQVSDPTRRAIVASGKTAQTRYRTIQDYNGYSLLEASPITGRTHQLRVHFSALRHAVVGDRTYGERTMPKGLTRQFLHAAHIEFTAPSGKHVACDSKLPDDLDAFLATLTT